MKAIYFTTYGEPDVLQYGSLPDPAPGPGEVRIRVRAAGVNPVDTKVRRGLVQSRIPHVLPIVPGWDAAGEIDAVGSGVTRWKPGQAVYAYARKPVVQWGAYAEYLVLPETQVAAKPASLDWNEAASVPLAALTAWQSLFDTAGLERGQRVLIHAGAGGVGGFAIQLAKHAGCWVAATASAANRDYVRSLGADEVIDYTAVDFRPAVRSMLPVGVDVAYDTVGGDVQDRSAEVVRPGGVLVSILAFRDREAIEARGVSARYLFVSPNVEQLDKLAALFERGALRTRVSRVWPLEQAIEAHRQIQTGHTAGKLVLSIA